MESRKTLFLTATLAVSLSAIAAPQPASAVQAEPNLAAESCIAYREDGQGGYRLSNACDYIVDVAFCTQPKNDPGLCLRTQNFTRETLKAKSEGIQKVWPEQDLICLPAGHQAGLKFCLRAWHGAVPRLRNRLFHG